MLALAVVLPYLVLVAVKMGLAQGLDTPLKVDELGYLGNARYLATGEGVVDATGRSSYKVGYSLFLTPAFWADRGPVEGFKAAQFLNAWLLSLVFPLAFVLAGRLQPSLTVVDRALLAGTVSLYPAALLYATTAMSANVFIPCFFLYVLAAHTTLDRPSAAGPWALWGGAAALLYGIHERAIGALGVAVVAAIVAAVVAWRRRWPRPTAPLTLVATVAATGWLLHRLAPPGAVWDTGGKSSDFVLLALSTPHKLWTTFVGQLWYLVLATAGVLVVAGLYRGVLAQRPPRDPHRPRFALDRRAAFGAVVAGAAGSVFAVSVFFMAQRPNARFSHWIYGRYNDGVLLPVLLIALVALWEPGRRLRRRPLVLAVAGSAAVVAVLSLVLDHLWYPTMGGPFSFSGLGVAGLGETPLGWGILRSGALALVALGAIGTALAWRWRAGVALLALFFMAGTTLVYRDTWSIRYRVMENQHSLATLVERIAPAEKVIYHAPASLPYHFHYYNLSYRLPSYAFRKLPRTREARRGALVLGGRRLGFGADETDARLVALENLGYPGVSYRQALWVLPGDEQRRLAERGWLLPPAFPTELPREALAATLAIDGPSGIGLTMRPGASRDVVIQVGHRGSAPWPNTLSLRQRPLSVGLEVRWNQGRVTRKRQWIGLPRTLFPGDQLPQSTTLVAPTAPGAYRLAVTVTQELADGGRRRGSETLVLNVEVTP